MDAERERHFLNELCDIAARLQRLAEEFVYETGNKSGNRSVQENCVPWPAHLKLPKKTLT